ncbi:prolyl oligopeptidase family protein [Phenylobacterium sp.]|uniref:prolyl oligopeptidase family serine peptidase n=1 Tax=Phenylobacterium sp. TaxID=1871053 RepID=UPI0027259640|nr:prolyl oligopeptidase family serine peptidase [Phenylobacterium sp.]MDO8802026.1 prolyl oligopeptidase family serine peptidase [Phenylobacterium sp.]
MKISCAALTSALLLAGMAHAQAPADPFIWLEDVDAPRSMDWVAGQNAKAAKRLETDPRYATYLAQARAIFTAKDRIPWPTFRAGGVDNLWQDDAHVHGVWRHATLASYAGATPVWETLLDLDALSATEGKNWIWKGATCLKPAQTVCLVELSNGGGDAVEIREFDTVRKAFVEGGFRLTEGKQSADWLDADTLVVDRIWTPGDETPSGYAYIAKILTRDGQTKDIYRGQKSDVGAGVIVLRGEGGKADGLLGRRGLTFFENEFVLLDGGKTIALPRKAEHQAYVDGQAIFQLKEAWGGFGAGALIAYNLEDLKTGTATPALIFQPGPRQAITEVSDTHGRLVVTLLDEVKGAVDVYDRVGGKWTVKRLALPKDATFTVRSTSGNDDQLFVAAEGFLDPTSLWLADAASGQAAPVKALPARFNAATHQVKQYWATSTDGAKIPYFVVLPKGAKLDGSLPTIMYGYGGFEVAKPPIYLPEMGKIWLERGGAYVIANIRGGGEFGPAWHQSVLREKRQLSFDDFAAVARDLAARKVTSARRLGIYGRSNGGVLTTVSMTQHPELWNAVVVESPLIDMLRYHKLPAGASWIGEYGDPDVPADRAFIETYSGYQNLKAGTKYPEPYITTNTRDDRVHPGHARKFAARLEAMGVPYLYYEQTFGGHANDADPELNARRWARHYVYLAQKLMD